MLDVRSIDSKDLRKAAAPAAQQAYRVFVAEAAFDRAVERGAADTGREVGGVLVGQLLRDEAGPYLLIEDTIDALHAEEKGAELTFTHETWEHIHREMDSKHGARRVVGWYHTHPGFGIFLSDRDQFIHKSFFNLPFQVAFVYDPKSREHGMFAWQDNEVARMRRYWVGVREQLWDGARVAAPKIEIKPGDEPARSDARDAGERRDELNAGSFGTLALLAVVMLVIGGFVGHWFGAGSANQVVAQAQIEIARARQDGAVQTMSALQHDLVSVLRGSIGDEAMRAPVGDAILALDRAIMALPPETVSAAPTSATPAAPTAAGSGATAPTAAGSAAAVAAGSAAPAAAGSGAAPAAGAGSGAAAPAVAAIPAIADAGAPSLGSELRAARSALMKLLQSRRSAEIVLTQLELASRRSAELRSDLAHDVSSQRSGLGALYAELAGDAVKAGDPARARRLLTTAAHLDPGNRARYERQLQTFDPKASLPRESSEAREPDEARDLGDPSGAASPAVLGAPTTRSNTGSAGAGSTR